MGMNRVSFIWVIIALSVFTLSNHLCEAESILQNEHSFIKVEDKPIPQLRWKEIIEHFEPQIRITAQVILPRIPWYLKSIFWLAEKIMENTSSSFDGFGGINREIYMEYVGIAKIMKMEVYEVMITNFEYELLAFCTSIVAHYSGQGIIHGRNMDYLLYQYMEDITYNGDFYKNGVKIYSAVMFAGYTGVFTAIKPEKFAISINERRPNGTLGLFFNLVGWMILTPSPAMHVRRICEQARNYTEAKNMLINKPITAPVYFTISGTEKNEGAIITRDRLSSADVWELNDQSSTDWVIVQTNYDHWISPAPTFDKNRADTAKESLKMLSRSGLNENTMMSNVIQKPPVKNQGTIYSTVMVPKTGYIHTVRYV